MPSPEELAFLARVRERPDEDAPRLMFADWLDDRGDPRGEFIRVQCALARLPADDARRPELEAREHDLLESYQKTWADDLRGLASDWTCRRGLIEAISVDAEAFLERGAEVFRHGPIRRVRFLEAGKCFPRLVASPLLARIPEVDLVGNFLGNGGVALLARARHLDRLEVLHLGFNDLTDQGLRSLAEIPHLANLRELYLDDNKQFSTPGIRALADSPFLGNLRLLDLSGNGLAEPALKVLINGDAMKNLDALRLAGNQIADGGLAALACSDLLRRMLERSPALDLSRNNIGPVGARALAESPLAVPAESLDLGTNAIGDAGLMSLAQSPHLANLRELVVRDNRIGDPGVVALARARTTGALPALESIDLIGNFVTADRLEDLLASGADWRRPLEVKADANISLRPSRRRPRPAP